VLIFASEVYFYKKKAEISKIIEIGSYLPSFYWVIQRLLTFVKLRIFGQ